MSLSAKNVPNNSSLLAVCAPHLTCISGTCTYEYTFAQCTWQFAKTAPTCTHSLISLLHCTFCRKWKTTKAKSRLCEATSGKQSCNSNKMQRGISYSAVGTEMILWRRLWTNGKGFWTTQNVWRGACTLQCSRRVWNCVKVAYLFTCVHVRMMWLLSAFFSCAYYFPCRSNRELKNAMSTAEESVQIGIGAMEKLNEQTSTMKRIKGNVSMRGERTKID